MFDAIYFDMDGTLADLYGVDGWEEKLHSEDATPYQEAQPLVDMCELCELIDKFIDLGIQIGIISWLAKNSTKEYDTLVRKAKREWVNENLPNRIQEEHYIKYGRTKKSAANMKNSILVDDNKKVRDGWTGYATIDANEDILAELRRYIDMLEEANKK